MERTMSREGGRFLLPSDSTAWWGFISTTLAGLAAVARLNPARLQMAVALAFAMGCLFLASEWISSLHGKSYLGDVPKGPLVSAQGWTLLSMSALGLAAFMLLVHAEYLRFWVLALSSAAALTVFMFLLRMEMVPVDLRLVVLSGLLCTLPALLLGFLAMGEREEGAWTFWIPAAVYFPAGAAFRLVWLEGMAGGRRRLATVTAPLLPLIVAALYDGQVLGAMLLAAYFSFAVLRLNRRFSEATLRLPAFSEIRRLERLQHGWNAALVAAWAFFGSLS